MSLIKLMIVDDHCMVREGLKKLLEDDENIQIVAEAGNGNECLDMLSKITFDILLLNLDMPDKSALDVLKELSENHRKNFKILVLTGYNEIEYFLRGDRFIVDGYVLKSSKFEELKKAIYLIMDGEVYIQNEIKVKLNYMEKFIKNDCDKIDNLTKRELEVLENLSMGMYNKEIALKLEISERTVKNHISNIFKKIGVADRTQAAVFAIRNYLVDVYHK